HADHWEHSGRERSAAPASHRFAPRGRSVSGRANRLGSGPKPLWHYVALDYSAEASTGWQAMLIRGLSGRRNDRCSSCRPCGRAGAVVVAGFACGAALALATPAAAQQYRVVGDPVTIDYGVLDSLGPEVPEATRVPAVPTIRRVLPPAYGP